MLAIIENNTRIANCFPFLSKYESFNLARFISSEVVRLTVTRIFAKQIKPVANTIRVLLTCNYKSANASLFFLSIVAIGVVKINPLMLVFTNAK